MNTFSSGQSTPQQYCYWNEKADAKMELCREEKFPNQPLQEFCHDEINDELVLFAPKNRKSWKKILQGEPKCPDPLAGAPFHR